MERRAITVQGIVQGVGFRPFVHGLAARLRLSGFVRNQTDGVVIEIEGDASSLDHFLGELHDHPPPLAHIEHLAWEPRSPCGDEQFRIETSHADAERTAIFVGADVATCPDCLAELFSPADRRFGYPFLNCTNCGPRLTIIRGVPYDRERTTMSAFPMCAACRAEYEDPSNRRFHAQPTCCPVCGPRLQLLDADGQPTESDDPLGVFVTALRAGHIGALKGLGGYHLVCLAAEERVVGKLRRRKHREEKPFAVMVADLDAVDALCAAAPAERALLRSPQRPIVLLRKQNGVAEAVAPGNPCLGVMLPYTPLHHLLLRRLDVPLVMTSGNRSDEPIAHDDADALRRLHGIADVFLTHNRPIHVRCDDSVTRVIDGQEVPLRRSRGYAPQPITLPFECRQPILAVGGQLKGAFAVGRGRHAFLSHHLGDLDHYEAYRAFLKDADLYEQLFAVRPQVLAHDLHPDYAATRYATERARADGLDLVGVQHHHAHLASCMAEHGLTGSVIGVTFDGTGYGTDGAIWGGEFLVGDYREFRRAAHLRYVGLPGGERAIREPWRMALAHLIDAGEDATLLDQRIMGSALRTVAHMLAQHVNTPPTSSAGRLFDAVASLAGLRDRVSHEGQAAMELEWRATGVAPDGVYPFEPGDDFSNRSLCGRIGNSSSDAPLVIDTRPLIRAVATDVRRGVTPEKIARRFHSTMVEMIAVVCARLRGDGGPNDVVLSGGVFMNALLSSEVAARLTSDGFRVHRHRLVPANDGGLALGQLAVAAAAL
jgi:hydrogenase maturation protein HypF